MPTPEEYAWGVFDDDGDTASQGTIAKHIRLAVSAERELCMKIADEHRESLCVGGFSQHGTPCMLDDGSCEKSIAASIKDFGTGKCSVHERCGKVSQKLGRFGHHPDAATDFCMEVGDIEGLVEDVKAGLEPKQNVEDRIFKAMQFRVGGVPHAVSAKAVLRQAEAALKVVVSN